MTLSRNITLEMYLTQQQVAQRVSDPQPWSVTWG
uniref:Uncharacterized protein n=1 Tax=Phage sp. ctrsQ3 TaxID=2826752 RepID=A0A8S5MG53_9VIRU|nr:MAG TPA: hypothetical protein [Phage sp. ctrsQ3]